MTITEMQEMVRDLQVGEPCPLPHTGRHSLIICPEHVLVDGWCECCDTGFTEAPEMQCPCEWW